MNNEEKVINAGTEAGLSATGNAAKVARAKLFKNGIQKQLGVIIVIAAVFIMLLLVYIFAIKPLTEKEQDNDVKAIELIWQDEINYANTTVLMYEHIDRTNLDRIDIHNPANAAKYGEQYVDWGIYSYESTDGDSFIYYTDYEFSPYSDEKLAYLLNACGLPIISSRIEDHCTDYSKYGLDYKSDEDAVYYVIKTKKGASYKVYIGDRLPSGTGYYVRIVGKDILLSTGEEMDKDTVYLATNTSIESTVLASPQAMMKPYLSMPIDKSASSTFDYFLISNIKTNVSYAFKPVNSSTDPFSVFAGMSIYYSVQPKGYYASSSFENLISVFEDFEGSAVIELATPQPYHPTEEEIAAGGEIPETVLGFTEELLEKYHLANPEYVISFKHAGLPSEIYFSPLQENSYYYAYSLDMNTIVLVPYETAYFLTWNSSTFISSEVVSMKIDNCESVTVSGSYYDYGVEYPERKGVQTVNETYQLEGIVKGLTVTTLSNGNQVNTASFRELFRILLQMTLRDSVSQEDVQAAMKNEAFTTIKIVTRESTVYKKDSSGNDTTEIEGVIKSVTRVYRFYNLTNGKCLVTTESINEKGISTGEVGSFYMMSARVRQFLSCAISVNQGLTFDGNIRY